MSAHSKEHALGAADHSSATLSELNSKISDATLVDTGSIQLNSEKGNANGYAGLDSGGKVPTAQLPDTVVGAVEYKGTWDASLNIPDLPLSSPDKGDYYVVSVSGSTSLGGITDWVAGDIAIYNGSAWEKIDTTDKVPSVFGRTGAVVAAASDYDASQIDNDSGVTGAKVSDALDTLKTNSHARSHAMTSSSDHSANNWKIHHSNGAGQMAEVSLGAANAPLLGGGVAAPPTFGAMFIASASVNAAGVSPVASDLAGWANETIGIAKGTGGAKFLCWKDSAGSYAVEMGSI